MIICFGLKRGFCLKYISRRQSFEFKVEIVQPKFLFVIKIIIIFLYFQVPVRVETGGGERGPAEGEDQRGGGRQDGHQHPQHR